MFNAVHNVDILLLHTFSVSPSPSHVLQQYQKWLTMWLDHINNFCMPLSLPAYMEMD